MLKTFTEKSKPDLFLVLLRHRSRLEIVLSFFDVSNTLRVDTNLYFRLNASARAGIRAQGVILIMSVCTGKASFAKIK